MKLLKIIGIVATASVLSGCGTKIDAWGLKIEPPEGIDFHFGTNSIDTVNDKRGVNSKEGAYPVIKCSIEVYN